MLEQALCFISLPISLCCKQICPASHSNLALVSPNSIYIKKLTLNSMQHELYLSKSIHMQSRSRMHLFPISTSFLNWTYCFSMDIESMPPGPGINSQKGMEAILSCTKPYSKQDTRGGVDEFNSLGNWRCISLPNYFGSFLENVCKYFQEQQSLSNALLAAFPYFTWTTIKQW